MSMISAQDVATLRSRLEQQIRDLRSKDSELRAQLAAEESATANTFVAGAEGALAAESDDEVIAQLNHDKLELNAAQQALDRMASGDYGSCAECGDPIGLARLNALPSAQYCVGCQDMAEHRKGH